MLSVQIQKALREFPLEVAFEVNPSQTLVLIGPSGCGKTTTLNVLAGLVTPDAGQVSLNGRKLWDRAARVDVPAERRNVGYVFQDFALFPHMTVADNVAYGLRARGASRAQVATRIDHALTMLGISHLKTRRPGALSGGERQRVALARAIACDSEILLLDEPLGSLDAQTRNRVRADLQGLLGTLGRIVIMVTHDYIDALTFGDKICVLDRGRMLQLGDRQEILLRPRSRFVAELTGVNFFEGQLHPNGAAGIAEVRLGSASLFAQVAQPEAGETLLTFFPSDVHLTRTQPAAPTPNVFASHVHDVVHMGDKVRVSLNGSLAMTAEVAADELAALQLGDGDTVFATVPTEAVRTYR